MPLRVERSLVAKSATGAGLGFNVPSGAVYVSWQYEVFAAAGTTTAATAITVALQGRLDGGASWITLDSATDTTGTLKVAGSPLAIREVRLNITAYTEAVSGDYVNGWIAMG